MSFLYPICFLFSHKSLDYDIKATTGQIKIYGVVFCKMILYCEKVFFILKLLNDQIFYSLIFFMEGAKRNHNLIKVEV